jgi:hypothetical protein
MFTIKEIRENLSGAWQVMNGDSAGLARLDTSIEGFWRSFGAIILIAPVFLLAVAAQDRVALELDKPLEGSLSLPVEVLVWLVNWILFPFLMAMVARPLGIAAQYVSFIVARNWATVLVSAILAMPLLAYLAGIISTNMLFFVWFPFLALSGYFAFRIVRTALTVPAGLAVGIVLADFGLTFMIEDLARALFG